MNKTYWNRERFRILVLTMLMVVALQFGQTPAFGSQLILGFGEQYGSLQRIHSGIDVAIRQGDCVLTPLNGTVSFVGKVPGVGGTYVQATTILAEDGRKVTLLPFARTSVKKGDSVKIGQTLGFAQGTGDGSSDLEHIHVSLRQGELYLDPSFLIQALMPASSDIDIAKETIPVSKAKTSAKHEPLKAQSTVVDTADVPVTSSPKPKVSQVSHMIQTQLHPTASETLIGRLERIDGIALPDVAQVFRAQGLGEGVTHRHAQSQAIWESFCALTRAQRALWLFLGGLILPCAGIGAVVVGRRTGLGIQSKKIFLAVRGNR